MKSKQNKLAGILALYLHAVASLLIACTHNPSEISRIDKPFRPHTVVYACGSVSQSYYESFLLQQFLQKLMVSLDNAVQLNSLGTTLIYNEVNENSFDPSAVKFDYQVNAIAADPASPTLTPTVPANPNDPMKSANKNAAIISYNSVVTAAYKNKLYANHDLLQKERIREQQATQAFLQSYHPVPVPQTDLWGCIAAASEHFKTEAGTHLLLIASDHVNTILLNKNAQINLNGVVIKAVYRLCTAGAPLCQVQDNEWKQYFLAHGAKESDISFLSPEQSDMLPTLF